MAVLPLHPLNCCSKAVFYSYFEMAITATYDTVVWQLAKLN